jgi:CRISPR-associated protein Csm2
MGHGNRNPQQSVGFPTIDDKTLQAIITGADPVESARLTVEWGEKVGEASKTVTSSQIRAIFTTVRAIEAEWTTNADEAQMQKSLRDFILLKSKLGYQAVRDETLKDLVKLLQRGIDLVKNREHFQRFVDFFEAILAYHKVKGGKN